MNALDLSFKDTEQVIKLLQQGKVGVMPTDTIYGIVGSALNPRTVQDIYLIRDRDSSKPMIILISSLENLKKFNILLSPQQKEYLQKIWPNPISVILPCSDQAFSYLHRNKNSLAFRLPKDESLLDVLKETGPLVAPSANPEKQKPAETIEEAKKYFGDKMAFYLDGGKIQSIASTVLQLYEDGSHIVLRKGTYKIP